MSRHSKAPSFLVALLTLIAVSIGVRGDRIDSVSASPLENSANSGAMSVYSVSNPNPTTLAVQHEFSDPSGFHYSFWTRIPPHSTQTFHVGAMPQVPRGFQGKVTLSANQAFTSRAVGFDYPAATIH